MELRRTGRRRLGPIVGSVRDDPHLDPSAVKPKCAHQPHTQVWVENYEEDDADGGDDDELGSGSGEDTKWEEEL